MIFFREARPQKTSNASVGDQNGEKKQFAKEVPSNVPKQTEKKKKMISPNDLSHLERKLKKCLRCFSLKNNTFYVSFKQ